MIPLRDNVPTRRFPVVTVLLIAANVVTFVVDLLTRQPTVVGHVMTPNGPAQVVDYVGGLSAQFSMVPAHITNDFANSWFTIFTSMFLHANWLHIGGNMLYLWVFGNNVEDVLGRPRYVVFYLTCGAVAAFAQIATDPQSQIPTVGASGAIAGLLGAYLVLFPDAEILSIVPIFFFGWLMDVPAILVIGFWAILQFLHARLPSSGMQQGGVAYFAHVGGFLAGIAIILLLGGRRLVEQRRRPDNDYYIR